MGFLNYDDGEYHHYVIDSEYFADYHYYGPYGHNHGDYYGHLDYDNYDGELGLDHYDSYPMVLSQKDIKKQKVGEKKAHKKHHKVNDHKAHKKVSAKDI